MTAEAAMEECRTRILLVEDDEDDYIFIRELLSEIQGHPFQMERTKDCDAALEAMAGNAHDVYLLDYQLGRFNGLEVLSEAVTRGCKAPIILLTGQGQREIDIEAMRAGAADYLTKGQIDAALLERSIRYANERQRDRDALRQARDELERRVQERTAALQRAIEALRTEIAERHQAEAALDRQREWSRVTLSSIGDAVIATDAMGRLIFLNSAAQTLTGWTQAEAAGQPLETVFHVLDEQSREPIENPVQKVVHERKTVGLAHHAVLLAKHGVERSIDYSAAPIRDAHGEITGVVLIFRDVSERRKSERMLRRQASLLEQTHDAIFVWEFSRARIVYWNLAAEQLYGIPKEVAIGRASHELLRSVFPQGSAAAFAAALERHGQWTGELVHTTQGGQPITVESHLRLMDEMHGKRLVLQTCRDVSDRKRAEEALRESEARFRHLADAMPQIVWTAQPDGCVDYLNRRWFEYTGFAQEHTFSPDGWKPILYPDDVAACDQKWAWAVQTGEPYQIEHRFKDRRTGGYRWHLGRAVPERDESGRIVRWFGTCTDIDDQKRAEEALRDADRHKDEFLAMLAHELRNPLAPILNGLHILRMSKLDGSATERVRSMMEQQVRNLTRLVDDLLDVSRITRGKIQLRKQTTDLTSVVGHAVEAARPVIELRKHELVVSLPKEPVYLEADVTRLEQILTNLLNNASKYTEPGGSIWLTAERENSEVVLRVRDNGIGIPEELLPRVFDMFTQADRTLDRSQGGLGIGLTLVHRLVELHGGNVVAHSEGAGKGSEFTVRLPALPAPRPSAFKPPPEQVPEQKETLRVLVVEDEVAVAEMLVMLLELWGHVVRAAHDGPTALAAVQTFQPEVILCDIGLPGMDGYELARQLQLQEGPTKAILIAVTGYGQEEDRRRAERAGFDRHMTKPVDPAALEELLARCASAGAV
jgi:PAS domain S-box-containing protein